MHRYRALPPLFLLLLLCSCASQPKSTASLFAMDTVMDLTAYGPQSQQALEDAQVVIRDLDSLLSVTDPASEISRANAGQQVPLSPQVIDLLTQTLTFCASTNGALDVTIYPLIRTWGFTTGDYQIPTPSQLQLLLEKVDYRQVRVENGTLSLPPGVELDLGASAKGYTGDRVMEALRAREITSAIVTLGGNVHTLGARPDGTPWRVGIRAPDSEEYTCIALVQVTDKAVVTSGGYERYFERDGRRYCHILDPATGYPAESGLASVTIVSPSGTLADCLSTALFVMGREKAVEYWRSRGGDFDFVLIGEDGGVTVTQGLTDSFSLCGEWEGREWEVVEL